MGLFSFLQRKKPPVPETRKRTPPPQDPVTVEALRTRARRRLIGAAVLVGGAVIGLPTLFDKPPRPAEQSFSVRMAGPAGSDGSASVSVKAPAPAPAPAAAAAAAGSAALARQGSVEAAPSASVSGTAVAVAAAGTAAAVGLLPGTGKKPHADDTIITETKADLEADKLRADRVRAEKDKEKAKAERARADKLKADKAREAEKAQEAEQAREAEKARQERLAKKAKEAKEAKAAREAQDARDAADARREAARKARDAREAKVLKDAKEAKDAKAAKATRPDGDGEKTRRYVIQAGSFAEASAARDLGRRIGKLGLDSHEQRVETASGSARTRVRLGPFNSKEEALRAAARLKAAGLNAAVLPL
jgi:DedD protein